MLHEFLTANREELVRRCRAKVANRPVPAPTAIELEHGIPLFLEQLIGALQKEQGAPIDGSSQLPVEIGVTAGKHGGEFFRKGFTVDQVVHDYGDLCQSVTELAAEKRAPVTVDEFRTFNRCLDNAIADAVSNLLQNAFKFSRPNGTVSLTARAAGDRILIDVEDECGGLPDGKAEELFRPFEQKSNNRTGLGLGLSISRRAVQANDGDLNVRNLAGKGCVFTIDLPRSGVN
jgi:signal transduction histidine kinase